MSLSMDVFRCKGENTDDSALNRSDSKERVDMCGMRGRGRGRDVACRVMLLMMGRVLSGEKLRWKKF